MNRPLALVLALLSAFLALPTACRPDQIQAAGGLLQLAGVVCDVAADKSGEPVVEYVCEAIDVAPPVLSLIPTVSASAPPPGVKSGPPAPPAAVAAPKRTFTVKVAREARADFEKKNLRK